MTAIPDTGTPRDAFEGTAPVAAGAALDLGWGRRTALGAGQRRAFASVVAHGDLRSAAAAWLELQATAPASPYQTFAWAAAWVETEGLARGVRPLIGVARDERGCPVALLPLGLKRRGLVAVASFLGGRHSNYNLGLFDPAVAWTDTEVARLLQAVAAAAPGRIDMFALVNQPPAWGEWRNPLALLPAQPSPSLGHRAVLEPDGEAFLRRHLSSAARKKLRSKATQLEALGPVSHVLASAPADVDRILDAYLDQKTAKLASLGTAPRGAGTALRSFLSRAADPGREGAAPLELHALLCGSRMVATFGGLAHAGRFGGLLISHDAEPAFARLSPGELLLAAVVRQKCAAGFGSFDLGIGEARYKRAFCPIDDPLLDSFVPITLLGRLCVAGAALRGRAKGGIKQSAWAWPLLLKLRKVLARARMQG